MLALVCPYFRKNITVSCKIVFVSCSLDKLFLVKMRLFSFLENKLKDGAHLEKNVVFDLLFTSFNHQGKEQKIPSVHSLLAYIHVFISPFWHFCLSNFEKKKKKTNLLYMLLFGTSPSVDSYSRHFGAING